MPLSIQHTDSPRRMEVTGPKLCEKDELLSGMNTYLAAQGEPLKEGENPKKDMEQKTHKKKKKKKKKNICVDKGWWDRRNKYITAKEKLIKGLEDRNYKAQKRDDPYSFRGQHGVLKGTSASTHLKRTTGIPR